MIAVTVRSLGPADGSVLSSVAPGVFDDPVSDEAAKIFLTDPNHFLVVAQDEEKGGLVVGFVSAARTWHPDEEKPELWINEVAVAPDYRRQCIGKGLMRAMLDEAKKAGCRGAWLAVDPDNDAARALYASVGGKALEKQLHIEFDLIE